MGVVGLMKVSTTEDAGTAASGERRKLDDAAIVAALDRSDRREAVLLCSRHHGAAIGRLCMSLLGSQQDAEDVTQETLIDAYAAIDSWRREGSVRAWLMTIARRKCARVIEKRARRTQKLRLVHDADQPAPSSQGTEAEVMNKQRAERARAALDALKPSEREALLLRFGAGLSFREIGLCCDIEEAAARKRVSRAISRMREALEEKGMSR